MRAPVAVLVLALAACHGAAPRAVPTTAPIPVPTASRSSSPAPAGVYLTTTSFTPDERGVEKFFVRHVRQPVLHGLPPAVLRRANAALAAAVGTEYRLAWQNIYYGDTYGSGVLWLDPEITAIDDRYVTVDLLLTHLLGEDPAVYDVTPVVLGRATGRRITADSMLTPAGVAAAAAYVKTRIREVSGRAPVNDFSWRYSAIDPHRFTPLPEGLRVVADGWLLGAGHDDPFVVVVPWARLAPHLRIALPRGDRHPAYRDGRPAHEWEVALFRTALRPGEAVTRWQVSQYVADRRWALGQSGRSRVVLYQTGIQWRLVDRGPAAGCTTLPAPVRASFALRCS